MAMAIPKKCKKCGTDISFEMYKHNCVMNNKEKSKCCGESRDWFYGENCLCGKPFEPVEDLCSKCKIGLHLGDPCECGCHKKPVEEKCCGKLLTPHGQEFTCGQTLPCIWHSKPDKTESKYDVSTEIIPLKKEVCANGAVNCLMEGCPNCTPKEKESWEEELWEYMSSKAPDDTSYFNVKSLINSLLSSERSRLLHELEEEVKGMLKKCCHASKFVCESCIGFDRYNEIVADLLKLIQEKGNEL